MKLTFEHAFKHPEALDEYNAQQIQMLRAEASQVKSCFTTFTFQTVALVTALMMLVANFGDRSDSLIWGWLAAVLVLLLASVTGRIGIFKFATANRIAGFEIHLARCVDYCEAAEAAAPQERRKLMTELRRVDWEEAMFAWRVVQPVIYEILHGRNVWWIPFSWARYQEACTSRRAWLRQGRQRPRDRALMPNEEYRWDDSRRLLAKWSGASPEARRDHEAEGEHAIDPVQAACRATFYPGSYLRKMEFSLGLVSLAALAVACILSVSINPFLLIPTTAIGYAGVVQWIHIARRVANLESGLTSIQTSAFVWRLVVLSHVLARTRVSEARRRNGGRGCYEGYTCELAAIATREIAAHLKCIHDWASKAEDQIIDNLNERFGLRSGS